MDGRSGQSIIPREFSGMAVIQTQSGKKKPNPTPIAASAPISLISVFSSREQL